MLLKALVVRSTKQKDESLSDTAGRFLRISFQPAPHGDELLSLAWNGQDDSYCRRRDCSAWPGLKPRKVLGPLTRFMTNIRRRSIIMCITWLEIANRQTI